MNFFVACCQSDTTCGPTDSTPLFGSRNESFHADDCNTLQYLK